MENRTRMVLSNPESYDHRMWNRAGNPHGWEPPPGKRMFQFHLLIPSPVTRTSQDSHLFPNTHHLYAPEISSLMSSASFKVCSENPKNTSLSGQNTADAPVVYTNTSANSLGYIYSLLFFDFLL